jgi:hypothetical protein
MAHRAQHLLEGYNLSRQRLSYLSEGLQEMKMLALLVLVPVLALGKSAHTYIQVSCLVLPRPVVTYVITGNVVFKTVTY